MRVLALVTDAFGASGGIANYNRTVLAALCAFPQCEEIVGLPRALRGEPGPLPPKLRYVTAAAAGKACYALAVLREVVLRRRFDWVFCGHINLLPLAWLAARVLGAPLVLQTYGIEVFDRPRSPLIERLASDVDLCLTISRTTRAKFLAWARYDPHCCIVLPPAFEQARFTAGARDPHLQQRLGLQGRKMLLTVGRLDSCERYKGHDTILRSLPSLLVKLPGLVYVIAGDGDDRSRLETLADQLGVAQATRFVGTVSDAELPALYRLADAFVMPSTGEGFGIVFLEAAGSGIPVVAGDADGARDALRDGKLGTLVDAGSVECVSAAIMNALRGSLPARVDPSCFSFEKFSTRLQTALMQRLLGAGMP